MLMFILIFNKNMLWYSFEGSHQGAYNECPQHIYSRLPLSRIPSDFLKHFEISVPRNISVAEVRKTVNRTTSFKK